MEPACSLTVPSLFGSSGLVREKQLFEKFWKGTFKAVATPRLESVIVASITARTRVADMSNVQLRRYSFQMCCFSLNSRSFDEDLSPRPKAKKKKRKSQRKRKRKRSLEHVCAYLQMLSSKSGSQVLEGKDNGLILKPRHDYDSGNDTSSPPSCKTDVCKGKRSHSEQRLASPDKHKFTDRDNGSDSGNSVTSYASLCNNGNDSVSTSVFKQMTLGCGREGSVKSCCSHRGRRRSRTHRSRTPSSSSRSTISSRHYSRSISMSSCKKKNISISHLLFTGVANVLHCFTLRRRTSSSRESKAAHSHKKRRRRKSYSPMKKRRRDSPSHLEARRITSARKRPVPYFRRSPSSSTSVSSWSSLFTRSRSRSAPYRLSRTRSRSYSSYRSYSRSSSWNSVFGTRSRSRSSGHVHKCHRKRKRH
uniref:Serine/arginine repetitive matrix protein C-terminal domain-containing protein n=1 Tax=Periophthalmus magnuspinnatus TaxID=409849 RepID=A0A3B3ZZZ4_9GOBI